MTNHSRHSIRLQGYNYAQSGAYFVTICAHQRLPLFGKVLDGTMVLSDIGAMVETEWLQTAVVRPNVELDAFVVMPNHLHGIIVITDNSPSVGATRRVAPASTTLQQGSLGAIIGQFKSIVTKQIRQNLPDPPDHAIWQRNYHDHIIRSAADLNRIRDDITHNPVPLAAGRFFA